MKFQRTWSTLILAVSLAGLLACGEGTASSGRLGRVEAQAELTSGLTIKRGSGAVADATINSQLFRTNRGDEPRLVVSKKNEALLRFDVSAIPSNAIINSATLTLYQHGHADSDDDHDSDDDDRNDERQSGFSAVPIQLQLATAPWVESKVTYASFNQQIDAAVAGILLPSGVNTYRSVDLKASVQAWASGAKANDGIVLRTTSRHRWGFASSEAHDAALRPSLTISYSTPDEHCKPNPCQNAGVCTNGWTGYTCACAAGYTGANCQTNINDCGGSPCQNGGTCVDGVNSYTCSCAAGFSGANCQTNIDDCASHPCQNGGVCTDGVNSYTCACALGYTGANCQTLIDECAGNPCQNGATCTNGVGTYSCNCAAGFTGTHCETNIDDCATAPCQNGGSCVDGINSYSCACVAGFTGANCQTNINDCVNAPCQNGGACTDGVNSYSCSCAAGFAGANCEINIDDCASHPCQNGGVCVDGVASYTCSCAAGYTGASCETNVDDCSPNPCQNGGVCTDGTNSHTCACPSGYTGANCETPVVPSCPASIDDGDPCTADACDPATGVVTHTVTAIVPPPTHKWTFNDGTAADSAGGADGSLHGGATIANGALVLNNATTPSLLNQDGQRMTAPIGESTTTKTLVSWVTLDNLPQHGGSALTLESTTTNPFAQVFDAVDYAEQSAGQWMAGSNDFVRSPANSGAAETSTDRVAIAIAYDAAHGITLYRNGAFYAGYTATTLQAYQADASDVLIGLRHSGCSNNCWLSGKVDEARIYPVALNACQVKLLAPEP